MVRKGAAWRRSRQIERIYARLAPYDGQIERIYARLAPYDVTVLSARDRAL